MPLWEIGKLLMYMYVSESNVIHCILNATLFNEMIYDHSIFTIKMISHVVFVFICNFRQKKVTYKNKCFEHHFSDITIFGYNDINCLVL